ncbi:MAG: hypothetical protein ACLR5Q_09810 [Coprococcus sp.]
MHIFMAHTDTVFPDETEIPVVVEDGCIKAPGVGMIPPMCVRF